MDGFAFGAAGQSGQGYTPQLESSFPGALSAWAAHAQPDVWIQGLAQQNSQPPAMLDYLHELRRGLGDQAEVVWALGRRPRPRRARPAGTPSCAISAPDAGVAAIFAVGHPRVGSYFAQAASGMRTDDAHYSSFGSRVIAQAWLDQLCELVLGDCAPADVDGDAAVTVYDVLAYQGLWDAQDPRADLDGDGRLLVFDYLLLLTLMDRCGR
ncbi:MAG: hypothetical protein KatS3mg103_0363 [Phycisphaerales bacterium]|nr:MAG: hypothetical protein KatS3mg103_0363 [Phycisphaerales bacterium]